MAVVNAGKESLAGSKVVEKGVASAHPGEHVEKDDRSSSIGKEQSTDDNKEPELEWEPDIDYATASTYNIYHRKDGKEHFIITPLRSQYRERCNPRRKEKPTDIFRRIEDIPRAAADNTFFVHKPYISFHHAPRTLRRGPRKDSPVVCMINNSWFWHKWKLQFGESLKHVIDPRGAMPHEFAAGPSGDGHLSELKGYKVRSWRLWGESGKKYHHEVNEDRKARKNNLSPFTGVNHPAEKPPRQPLVDEEVHFSWHSPFTMKTRFYCFNYAGLEFYWKGTGTVKETRTCGWWMRYHHLKLCVRMPILATTNTSDSGPIKKTASRGSFLTRFGSKSAGFREVCLAKYTSSMATKKAGSLQIYDDVLHRMFMDDVLTLDKSKKQDLASLGVVGVKQLRLYEIIIATAMCMVIAEWQKRETVIAIIALAGEGGGGAGG